MVMDEHVSTWADKAGPSLVRLLGTDLVPARQCRRLAIDIPTVKLFLKRVGPSMAEEEELSDDEDTAFYSNPPSGVGDSQATRMVLERCTSLGELLVENSFRLAGSDKLAIETGLRNLYRLELLFSASVDVGAILSISIPSSTELARSMLRPLTSCSQASRPAESLLGKKGQRRTHFILRLPLSAMQAQFRPRIGWTRCHVPCRLSRLAPPTIIRDAQIAQSALYAQCRSRSGM